MTTQESLNLYRADVLKWFAAKRDYPMFFHPEPQPANCGLTTETDRMIAHTVFLETKREAERSV